jgi:CobQ/CobB/MinD/ParA nucleotide binding domain
MKHFAEARRDAVIAVTTVANCLGFCLIWDLRGELRVLVRSVAGADLKLILADTKAAMSTAADSFWTDVVWIWSPDARLSEAEKLVYEEAWRLSRQRSAGPPEVRELDRHLSKETWFGDPLTPPWPQIPQTAPILSFYSFKGGVGRTTALAAFAIQMARAGKRVCIVDLDLEAPGIGTLLSSSTGQARFGVVDYVLEAGLGRGQPEIGDYFHLCDDPRVVMSGPPIAVVPAGTLDEDYLEKLARIDYQGVLAPSQTHTGGVLKSLLKALKTERQAEYVLIDSRSGLHDIGGLALNGISHLDVVFGLDSEQSWQGLLLIVSHLGRRRIERGQPHQLFSLVFSMAPAAAHPDRLTRVDAFHERAHQLLSDFFYDEEPDTGWPSPIPDEVWPVPAIEDTTEPHFAIPIGFNTDIQRASSIESIATLLTEGDYQAFGTAVLERLGRTSP